MYIGCDPEIFLRDAAGGLISAIDRIGGSKAIPRPLDDLGEGFAVQEDNVALEFNIPAASTRPEFQHNINAAMRFLSNEIQKQGLSFDRRASALFPEDQLMHPMAMEFGCDPDYNAWNNGRVNPRPKATEFNLRSCGGHVHVGHKFQTRKDVLDFIKRADLFLGVPSVLMDDDTRRRELYGKPGSFRYKPYGCEYRTLSNFWIFDNKTIDWVYDNTKLALESDVDVEKERVNILKTITGNNKTMAENLIKKYNIPYV